MAIEQIATGLQRHPDGYWMAPSAAAVSYPEGGNDFCLSIEESSFWFQHRNEMIVAAVRRFPPADGPLLDVGAGNGFVSLALHRAGIAAVAIEPNPDGARNAVRRGVELTVCGAFPSEGFRLASAGGVGLFDVLEHVEGDAVLLESLRPYLRADGRLYLTVPAHAWLWSNDDVLAGHHRRYTLATLRAVVTASGFAIEYATPFFSWLPLPIFLARTVPSWFTKPKAEAMKATRSQHSIGGGTARRMVRRCLSWERARLERGRSIPFGASLLLVARVRS